MKNIRTGFSLLCSFVLAGLIVPTMLHAQTLHECRVGKANRDSLNTVLDQALAMSLAIDQQRNGLPVTALVSPAELTTAFPTQDFLYNTAGEIAVSLRCQSIPEVLEGLMPLGFIEMGRTARFGILEGFIPVGQLGRLDALRSSGLLSARAILRPVNNVGDTGSQADTTLQAYRVRNLAPGNYDGSGVKVGVLSDSYDNLAGEAAGVLSGDLPADVRNLVDLGSGGSDEGRAMIELIHDLAPGATKYFATAFTGQSGFATNIQLLADSGCTVIVDDVVYFEEPFFQDGIIAQAVADVTDNEDAIYFSSAGNRADRAYENTAPTFSNDPFDGVSSLDFDTGAGTDHFQSFTLNDGESLQIVVQWDDPFYTISGVDTDLDVFILEDPPSTSTVLASATDNNLTTQVPSEYVTYTNNTGATVNVHLKIELSAGPVPGRIKYVNFATHSPDEFDTNSPTVNPHAGADECVAVAAAPFYYRVAESFTSIGPSTFLFDETGTALGAAEVRNKPDFTATDGCNTTFFGTDSGADPDAFPNFFGTSAAAPHAAAIACLARQAYPAETRDDIYNRLNMSAEDIGSAGFDFVTGSGIINGFNTLYSVTPIALPATEDFESATLGQEWEFFHTNTGRIQIYGLQTPATGSYHLALDAWAAVTGVSGLNEAILHVDATNASNISLSFDQKESGDEDEAMSATFTGSENSDGVALSVDGTNWYSLISLTGANSTGTYTTNSFDISTFATTNGLTLGSDVRIKFQQYDNFPFASDGITFDNIAVNATTLPVTLLSFEGEWIANQKIRLQWVTGEELNNQGFRIERSSDGIRFHEIDQVAGHGTTTDPNSYEYFDLQPLAGKNYYRLWQVDRDGSEHVSDVILLQGKTYFSAHLSPNPVRGNLVFVQTGGIEAGESVTVRLFDSQGRMLMSEQRNYEADQMEIQLPALAQGMYFLRLSSRHGEQTMSFLRD